MHSGQVFRYFPKDNGFLVITAAHWAQINVTGQQAIIKCSNADYFYRYFDFDTDYQQIKTQLSFPKLQKAIAVGGGIRILAADFTEMVISFIISANNNIKRFTKTLNDLCTQHGTRLPNGYYAFPTLEQLAKISVTEFKNLGCGYRDQYLVKAIKQLQTLNTDELRALPTPELYQKLLTIAGVGPKVASCILLFAFGRYEVAPVDTWIKKAISQLTPEEQSQILHGPYAGIAQQYIFYYLQHLHHECLWWYNGLWPKSTPMQNKKPARKLD